MRPHISGGRSLPKRSFVLAAARILKARGQCRQDPLKKAKSSRFPLQANHEDSGVDRVGAAHSAGNKPASREWEAWHWNKNWLCGRGARTLASLPPLSPCTLTISLHRAY